MSDAGTTRNAGTTTHPRPTAGAGTTTRVDMSAERLARQQMGVVARFQLVTGPADEAVVESRLRTGRWVEIAPGVYSFPGHRDSWSRSLWTSYLHAGPSAVVSHQSAAQLRSIKGIGRTISLTVERNHRHVRKQASGVRWHRLDDLSADDIAIEQGMRTTTVPRTLVDLAAAVSRQQLLHATEDAVVRKLTTVAEVGATLERLRRKGKPGVTKMCTVLDELDKGDAISASALDKALSRVVKLSGLPAPTREHPLPSVQCLTGFVDRYFATALLIVEADGRKWHERRRNMARDRERDLEAARTGHQTVRFVWEHLVSDPDGSARALVDIHRVRLAQLGRDEHQIDGTGHV